MRHEQKGFTITNGRPLPLGATVRPDGINFSIFSKNASAVTLDLFARGSGEPVGEIRLDPRLNRTGDIWHTAVSGLDHTKILYSYRVDGPWDKEKQHRFDKSSRLLDPYARSVAGAERWGGDYARVAYQKGFTRTHSDLRCAIAENSFDWRGDRHPEIPMEDLVIYELHVRGFTRHPSSGVAAPGTFSGLIEKLPYLKKLGVNAIELMPVHEFFESEMERANPVTGERLFNYWGYSTIAFFAPKASYAASGEDGGQVNEFRELVRSCHEHGMEVILDVVFNHTAEGNERGPSLSFRGLDNSVYYMLGPGREVSEFFRMR